MAKKTVPNVTMRVRLGDNEIEITGPSDFAAEKIAEFIKKQPAQSHQTSSGSSAAVTPQFQQPQSGRMPVVLLTWDSNF